MKLNENLTLQLGANASAYNQVMPQDEEQRQCDWASEKMSLIVSTLRKLPSRGRVADIGCRTGGQALYYQQQAGIREMHGFDISEEPLKEAREKGIVAHVWISGVSPCPVEDNFFDAVVAGDLIEHLMDTDVFLEELKRVVCPGGYLLITIPNLAWWWSRFRFLFGKVPAGMGSVSSHYAKDSAVDIKHLRVSVNDEWVYLFEQHGFECISVIGYNYPSLLRKPINILDNFLTRYPALAHSNLFLLRNPGTVNA